MGRKLVNPDAEASTPLKRKKTIDEVQMNVKRLNSIRSNPKGVLVVDNNLESNGAEIGMIRRTKGHRDTSQLVGRPLKNWW